MLYLNQRKTKTVTDSRKAEGKTKMKKNLNLKNMKETLVNYSGDNEEFNAI